MAKRAATQERLPSRVDLQLARLVPAAPEGREWLHEVKFDGYRVLLWRSAERVRISSRERPGLDREASRDRQRDARTRLSQLHPRR